MELGRRFESGRRHESAGQAAYFFANSTVDSYPWMGRDRRSDAGCLAQSRRSRPPSLPDPTGWATPPAPGVRSTVHVNTCHANVLLTEHFRGEALGPRFPLPTNSQHQKRERACSPSSLVKEG
jgi:hypothetical protein